MDYYNTPSYTEADTLIFLACLLLGAWSLFNYLKTVALLELQKTVKKYSADAKVIMDNSAATTIKMLDTGTEIQQQYLKLSKLNLYYDEIASQNKLMYQLCPSSTGKEGLLKDLSDDDIALHLTIVATGAAVALDNKITLIYKKHEDRIDFYDGKNWCVISANRIDHPDVFVWLNPYITAE